MTVSANEVKKRGVSLFGELLEKWDEVIINFRGEKKYVVMDVERYKELRALELDHAYTEVMEDIKTGDYEIVSAKEHIDKLKEEFNV